MTPKKGSCPDPRLGHSLPLTPRKIAPFEVLHASLSQNGFGLPRRLDFPRPWNNSHPIFRYILVLQGTEKLAKETKSGRGLEKNGAPIQKTQKRTGSPGPRGLCASREVLPKRKDAWRVSRVGGSNRCERLKLRTPSQCHKKKARCPQRKQPNKRGTNSEKDEPHQLRARLRGTRSCAGLFWRGPK